MTRKPEPRPATAKKTFTAPQPGPSKPAAYRFTDWAMI